MKSLFSAIAGAALTALAAPVSAQTYYPPPYSPPAQVQPPYYDTTVPGWTQDDGSSSDHPIPMPGDISGDQLNSQYRDGINVPPPNGFPAPYFVR